MVKFRILGFALLKANLHTSSGLSGYLYSVKQYEDVIAAVKVVDDNIFLPCDEDGLQDFMDGNTIDQLLSYVVSSLCISYRAID